jgi:hypothetical protein
MHPALRFVIPAVIGLVAGFLAALLHFNLPNATLIASVAAVFSALITSGQYSRYRI